MQPLPLHNLVEILQGRLFGDAPTKKVRSIGVDSRTIRAGELFWAIRGEKHDGHQFLGAAQKKGALAAVVSQPVKSLEFPQVIVEETVAALGKFSRWYREQQPAMVIGVTGSVGKTTTRRMIHRVLSQKYRGVESPANFNNQIGLPLSLLEIGPTDEFAVVELAASARGEIRSLGRLAKPEIAVITSIAEAHLTGFGSIETILSSKSELLETISDGGFAVLNGDDPRLLALSKAVSCPVFLYGFGGHNHFQVELDRRESRGWRFQVNGVPFFLPAVNRTFLSAAACAVAIASEVGMDVDEIRAGLEQFVTLSGRSELLEIGPWTVIDDTYNASPLSVRGACQTLDDWPCSARRMLVLGDMLELGDQSSRLHREIGTAIARSNIDLLVAHGEFAKDVAQSARASGMPPHQIADCPTLAPLEVVLDCWLRSGDVILVKGSRGMRMERIISWLQHKAAALEQETQHNNAHPHRAAA